MDQNFKLLIFFFEYLILPLLAIYLAFFLKSKMSPQKTLLEVLEDLDVDFRIISGLGISLFGLSMIGHNEHDEPKYYYYGLLGILITSSFVIVLFFRVLNTTGKLPVIRNRFFGLKGDAIYKFASVQICCLYVYVVVGLILKRHISDMNGDSVLFLSFLFVLSLAFFLYFDTLFSWLVLKLLKYQGVHSFNSLYIAPEGAHAEPVKSEKIRQISEFAHVLANKGRNDASAIPLLEGLSDLYEGLGEWDRAIECVDRIIALYENDQINKEPANIANALFYKVELFKRAGKSTDEVARLINLAKQRFPDNPRISSL